MDGSKNRISRLQNNIKKRQEADTRIVEAEREYEKIKKAEQKNKQIIHADNVNVYSNKRMRRNLLKRAERQGYPEEELRKVQNISDRNPFDVNTISEEDIQQILNVDIFVQQSDEWKYNHHQRTFLEKIVLGGDDNDS